MTEQEAIDGVKKFIKELEEVNKVKYNKGINYFDAVGMSNLETKHSRFFVWLFRNDKPHNFKNNQALIKLCRRVFYYDTKSDSKTSAPIKNKTILNCADVNELLALISGDITVTPEVKIDTKNSKTDSNRRYIDILIQTDKAVFVIENKTSTDTHTDQLQAYQDYVNANYPNLKKVFIFLSPEGQLPYNKGGNGNYNSNWCVFDYTGIVQIVNELLLEVKNGKITYGTNAQKEKLVVLLEDYIEMVKTDILRESPAVRRECQKILNDNQLKETLDMINDYIVNIASYDNVLSHVKQWLIDNYKKVADAIDVANSVKVQANNLDKNQFVIYKDTNKKSFVCYTRELVKYFEQHNEKDFGKRWRCLFAVGAADELRVFFQLCKSKKEQWSALQKAFITKYSLIAGDEQAKVESEISLSGVGDRSKFLDDVVIQIDSKLEKVVASLKSFEDKLLKL